MASGDVWRVELEITYTGVECRPGFHLVEGSGGGGTDPSADVNAAVAAALGAGPLAGFGESASLHGITVVDAQPGTRPTVSYPFGPAPGDVSDTSPLPPQSAAVISLRTALKAVLGAFAATGRIYMPGIPSSAQSGGFLQTDIQDALSAFASLLFDPFVTDGTAYQWHVVSYLPGSRPRTIRAIQPVTSFSINNVVRSQRRRERNVGM